jgi:hypothetical protein
MTGAARSWPLGHGADGGIFDALGGQLGVVTGGAVLVEPSHGYASVGCGWLEDISAAAGLELHERPITPAVFAAADEAFIAGLPFCLMPIATVDDRVLPGGAPGPVTLELLETWSEDVDVDLTGEVARLLGREPVEVR